MPPENPAVSVVVPMYNAAEYLPSLLTGLLSQTLENIEILCVDDGSTDDTAAIAKGFQREDARVRCFHQENSGAGVARNLGLANIRGEYLICLDADDLYAPDLCEALYACAKRHDADLVVCQYSRADDGGLAEERGLGFSDLPTERALCLRDMPGALRKVDVIPHNKLYRSAFARNSGVRYSGTRCGNDLFFFCAHAILADRTVCLPRELVTYRRYVSNQSISSNRGRFAHEGVAAWRECFRWAMARGVSDSVMTDLVWMSARTIDYNSQYADSERFHDAVKEMLAEPPWSELSPVALYKRIHFRPQRVDDALAALRKKLETCAPEARAGIERQIARLANRKRNLRRISRYGMPSVGRCVKWCAQKALTPLRK